MLSKSTITTLAISEIRVLFPYFCIVIGIVTIFNYNYRKRQIRLLYTLILLVFIGVFIILYEFYNIGNLHADSLAFKPNYNILLPCFFLAILFYLLAIQRIKKDHNLIKSIDRIR